MRLGARLTHADDDETERRLIDGLRQLVVRRDEVGDGPPVDLPRPPALQLASVMLPRDAFFGPAEQVPLAEAAGRIAAELMSPYPPGVPVIAPGERITDEVLDYLRTGVAAGMFIPDAADQSMGTIRVTA